jgi:hypothetical protein
MQVAKNKDYVIPQKRVGQGIEIAQEPGQYQCRIGRKVAIAFAGNTVGAI